MSRKEFATKISGTTAGISGLDPAGAEMLGWIWQLESSYVAGKSVEYHGGRAIHRNPSIRGEVDPDFGDRADRLKYECARLKRVTGFLAETESTLDRKLSTRNG